MSTKPTILFVPGSFAPPTIYKVTIEHLRNAGFPAVALQLPTTVKRMPLPPASMSDDADMIRRAAETVIGQGKEVVVVCHSYGGTPTTQALAGLKIKRLVYLSAIVPKMGQSNVDGMDGDGEQLVRGMVDGYMHIDATTMAGALGDDLSWDVAYEHSLNFAHHAGASFMEGVQKTAYTELPVSYIFCEKDLIVSPEKQRAFIKVLEEAQGKEIHVVSLDTGHCPNWTMPEKLGDVIAELAEKAD